MKKLDPNISIKNFTKNYYIQKDNLIFILYKKLILVYT